MNQSLDEYLTLHEAAALLKVSERTLWELAKDSKIPCFRVGKQYRFIRQAILDWAKSQVTSV